MNIYEFIVQCKCPVDEAMDTYAVTIEHETMIKVEDILALVTALKDQKIFQEDFTQRLARTLGAKVTTVGHHSSVKTTCVVP